MRRASDVRGLFTTEHPVWEGASTLTISGPDEDGRYGYRFPNTMGGVEWGFKWYLTGDPIKSAVASHDEWREEFEMSKYTKAENNVWHEDGTGFRKGRWTMSDAHDDIYILHHDDFMVPPSVGISVYWTRATGGLDDHRIAQVVQPVIGSFFAWHTENYPNQPAEPIGLGAVVCVVDSFTRCLDSADWPWVNFETGVSVSWSQICDSGLVTVLSEGVTS